MVGFRNQSIAIAATFLSVGLVLPALAQSVDSWADYLETIGGSTEVKTVGENSPEARPLQEFGEQIVAARFFKEKATDDPFLATNRALEAFAESCSTNRGLTLPDTDQRTQRFFNRTAAHLVRPTGRKHQWRAKAAICDGTNGEPLAGFLAVLQDNSEVVGSGDLGSRLLGRLTGMKTTTAIYLFKPDVLQSRQDADRALEYDEEEQQAAKEQYEQNRRQVQQFHAELTVGDETNCGTVIDVRGPMAEIALPANRRTPNGETIFWSRKERLLPPGYGVCTFGL